MGIKGVCVCLGMFFGFGFGMTGLDSLKSAGLMSDADYIFSAFMLMFGMVFIGVFYFAIWVQTTYKEIVLWRTGRPEKGVLAVMFAGGDVSMANVAEALGCSEIDANFCMIEERARHGVLLSDCETVPFVGS